MDLAVADDRPRRQRLARGEGAAGADRRPPHRPRRHPDRLKHRQWRERSARRLRAGVSGRAERDRSDAGVPDRNVTGATAQTGASTSSAGSWCSGWWSQRSATRSDCSDASAGVVPAVDLLERVVGEGVELALGAVVHVPGLVRGAHPAVAGDRAQVHAHAEQLAVPLGEHALEARGRRRRRRRRAAPGPASSRWARRPRSRRTSARGPRARPGSSPRPARRRRDGAGRHTSGSRISPSTWYGPLNSRPKSPCSSPWSVVKITSTSSVQPRALDRGEHAPERLVDELALDRVARVDLADLVVGQRRRHPVLRRLVVGDERAVVPLPPVARLGVEDRARARPRSVG